MNWTAHVNENMPFEYPVIHEHLKLAEACEFVGACAVLEASDALAEGIEGFLAHHRPITNSYWLAEVLEEHAKRIRAGEDIHGVLTVTSKADSPVGRVLETIDLDSPRLHRSLARDLANNPTVDSASLVTKSLRILEPASGGTVTVQTPYLVGESCRDAAELIPEHVVRAIVEMGKNRL